MTSILLTSFDTWLPEQTSNSSDDLLATLLERQQLPTNATVLRKLPVDFELAPQLAIAHLQQLQPQIMICLGMAQQRRWLNVEARACQHEKILYPNVELASLVRGLATTELSNDAGNFVCNHLYFKILEYLQEQQSATTALKLKTCCIFVHVPLLRSGNLDFVIDDFIAIMRRLTQISSC